MFRKQFNLSKQLLRSNSVLYLFLTFIMTIIHLSVDYQYTKNNIQDELKQIEVDYIRIQELVGHAPIKKDRMTTRYTKKYKLEILQSEINKLNFLI